MLADVGVKRRLHIDAGILAEVAAGGPDLVDGAGVDDHPFAIGDCDAARLGEGDPVANECAAGDQGLGDGGKGKVVILNAPPGIIIRDQRTNGFKKGLEKYPDIKIVADQSADWDRKKAQDVLSALMVSNKDITGVYGVNDEMALGAVDVLKAKKLLGKVVVFGNDGEKDALQSIEAGALLA